MTNSCSQWGGETHGYIARNDIERGIVHSTACRRANATCTFAPISADQTEKIVFEFENADALDRLGRQNYSPMIGIMEEHRITSERVNRRAGALAKQKKRI